MISDQGIGRRVAFVEAVAGEFFDQPEQFHRLAVRMSPLRSAPATNSSRNLAIFSSFFFADRFDAGIGARQLDVAQAIEDPHHLFLVDHHAVGLFQHFLHHRVLVLGCLRPCFTCT